MSCPVFVVGQLVKCVGSRNYSFTTGKTYVVQAYDPPDYWGNGFTCPAYVTVIDDEHKVACCHANRFIAAE